MKIPTNLLPINTNQINQLTGEIENTISTVSSINTDRIDSFKNRLSTSVPSISAVTASFTNLSSDLKQKYAELEIALPDRLFQGPDEQIQAKLQQAVNLYVNGLPPIPEIPTVSSLLPTLPRLAVPRLSYGQIKDFIERKKEEIRRARQEAFIKSQEALLEETKNAFAFRDNTRSVTTKLSTIIRKAQT